MTPPEVKNVWTLLVVSRPNLIVIGFIYFNKLHAGFCIENIRFGKRRSISRENEFVIETDNWHIIIYNDIQTFVSIVHFKFIIQIDHKI